MQTGKFPANLTTQDQIPLGIATILFSVTLLSFGDAIIKAVSSDLGLWQIFAVRALFALPCLIGLAIFSRQRIWPRAIGWTALRSLMLVCAWIAYYAALPHLDLATAAVAVYTNPIITALLAAALLHERVRPVQWLGVAVGFAGIVIILRPGTDSFTWVLFGPLLGAALYSGAMVLTRAKIRSESHIAVAISLNFGFFVCGVLGLALVPLLGASDASFLTTGWTVMGINDWALMALLGLIAAGFTTSVARAYQIAPPHIIGTFDYAYVGFAVLWGVLFFAKLPDAISLIGIVLIIGAGLLVAKPARARRLPV